MLVDSTAIVAHQCRLREGGDHTIYLLQTVANIRSTET